MSLFKYAPRDRIDVLENRQVKFTPATELNDPFEGVPNARILDDTNYTETLFSRMAEKEATAEIESGRLHASNKASFTASVMERIRAEFEGNRAAAKAGLLEAIQAGLRRYRILSLSRVPPDTAEALLLWAHYTDGHKGLVFEFDENHDWILGHDSSRRTFRDLDEVDYRKTRPDLVNKNVTRKCYLAKSEHWVYEKEFRLVRVDTDHDLDPKTSLAPFPPDLLVSVTLGVNCGDEFARKVKAALGARNDLAHVKLYRAQIHVDEYKIERGNPIPF